MYRYPRALCRHLNWRGTSTWQDDGTYTCWIYRCRDCGIGSVGEVRETEKEQSS